MNTIEPQPDSHQSFLIFVEASKGVIYKVANSYCRDAEDRKDLIQEIIIQLWRSQDRFNDQYALSTWVYRISLNVAISRYRKSKRRESEKPLQAAIELIGDDSETTVDDDNLRLLHQFIGELKELDRALMLLYLDEKSHQEISAVLGISSSNVATKLGRIKKSLKAKFDQENARHE